MRVINVYVIFNIEALCVEGIFQTKEEVFTFFKNDKYAKKDYSNYVEMSLEDDITDFYTFDEYIESCYFKGNSEDYIVCIEPLSIKD